MKFIAVAYGDQQEVRIYIPGDSGNAHSTLLSVASHDLTVARTSMAPVEDHRNIWLFEMRSDDLASLARLTRLAVR